MHERKPSRTCVYPTYQPYPVTDDLPQQGYSGGQSHAPDHLPDVDEADAASWTFPFAMDDDPPRDWLTGDRISSGNERGFRPLQLLNSLFADRLDFLRRALGELESARHDREQLTKTALEELDSEILECEHSLPLRQLDPDRRHRLERRLGELRRDRRKEKLLSWRDIVWLRGEIRKLQREIDALGRAAPSAENRDPPT